MYKRNDEMLKLGLGDKLIYAVATNDIDAVKTKLKRISQRQLDMTCSSYGNALLLASQDNNIEITKQLIMAGANKEVVDTTGCSPLAIALQNGYEELAQLLIDHGASVCHQSRRKVSILHYASISCSRRMIEHLLDLGMDINYLASDKLSALDFTTSITSKGNLEAAKTLVANGIDRNIITKGFKEACWRGNDKIAKFLLKSGADIEIVLGAQKRKPETLFWLCQKPNYHMKTRFLKTIRLLMEQGVDFYEKYNFTGMLLNCNGSPFETAKSEGFHDAVKVIREGEW